MPKALPYWIPAWILPTLPMFLMPYAMPHKLYTEVADVMLVPYFKSHAYELARICMGDDQLAGLCMVGFGVACVAAWCSGRSL